MSGCFFDLNHEIEYGWYLCLDEKTIIADMKSKGISPIYLVTNYVGVYEQYGWEFFGWVQGDDEPDRMRMYVHR